MPKKKTTKAAKIAAAKKKVSYMFCKEQLNILVIIIFSNYNFKI